MDQHDLAARLTSIREAAQRHGDPGVIALIDAAVERVNYPQAAGAPSGERKDLTAVGDAILSALEALGVSAERRTAIRHILAPAQIARPACW